MQRELGKDISQGSKRIEFLETNCDAVEEKGYMKPFPPGAQAVMEELRDNVIDKEIEKIKSLCPDIAIIEQ